MYAVKVSLNKTDRDRTAAEYGIELSHLKTWVSTPPTQQVHKKLQCPPLKIRCSCFQLQLVVLCAVARCCCCWQGKDVSVVSAWNSSLSSSQTSPPAFDWLSHSLYPHTAALINESKANVLSDWLIVVMCWAKPDRPISSHYYELYDDLNQHVMHTNHILFDVCTYVKVRQRYTLRCTTVI